MPPSTISNMLFEFFEKDVNDLVDLTDVGCGIALLCAGSQDEKIAFIFQAFEEQKGRVSAAEVTQLLRVVFRVVLTPDVQAMTERAGVSITSVEELASILAEDCMKTTNHMDKDAKLSVAEFMTWLNAQAINLSA